MKELKPRLLLPQSKRHNGGNWPRLFLVFILAFALGVYVGMGLNEWKTNETKPAQVKDQEISGPPADVQAEKEHFDDRLAVVEESDIKKDEPSFLTKNGSKTEHVIGGPSPSIAPVEENEVETVEMLETGLKMGGHKAAEEVKEDNNEEYTLQIAAFKTMERAEIGVNELKNKGYDAYTVPILNSKAESWNLIRIGKFKTREDAENLAAMLKGMEGIKAVIKELD